MAKTQAERLDDIDTKLELLRTQQRVVVQQNDKILEYIDAIYQSLAASLEDEGPPPPPDGVDEGKVNEIFNILTDGKGKEKEPYWGYNAEQERKAKEAGDGD